MIFPDSSTLDFKLVYRHWPRATLSDVSKATNRGLVAGRRTDLEPHRIDERYDLGSVSPWLEQFARWLEPYLEALSEQQRAVLFLRYVEELHRRSMASGGFDRFIVAGRVNATCASTGRRDRPGGDKSWPMVGRSPT